MPKHHKHKKKQKGMKRAVRILPPGESLVLPRMPMPAPSITLELPIKIMYGVGVLK